MISGRLLFLLCSSTDSAPHVVPVIAADAAQTNLSVSHGFST